MFKRLPNIQKYYHFYFTSQHPRIVFYKNRLEDDYKNAIVRNFSFDFNTIPFTINVRSLSLKRQKESYKEIAPYIELPFRNITCSKLSEQETN
jgi:predicted GTPase